MKYLLYKRGFTLIEMLVVVLIIGILGAIMLPQYQRAVLKSRFAALMPIAKSMADSNEAYYLEYGEYADNAEDLPVQGRMNYTDGTQLEFGTLTGYSYVLATRGNDFPNNYIVYQKHSEQFPGEIHCEADSNNTQAQEVCKSFGPTDDIGETLTPNYLTYVLFGTGNGVAPAEPQGPVCGGVACDEDGNITECASGQTLNNGACEACATAFPGAATCSTTTYKPTACSEGYTLNTAGTACVSAPLIPARAAVKDGYPTCDTSSDRTKCNYQYEGSGITITYDRPTLLGSLDCKGDPFRCSSSYTSSSGGGSLVQYNSGQGYYFELYYDKNGVFNGGLVTISGHQKNYYFDATGNLIGVHSTTFVPGYSWEVYDSNGNMRSLQDSSGTYYSYNEDGSFDRATQGGQTVSVTPTVTDVRDYKISETELAQARGYGPILVGKNKCELFPELQGC